MPTDAAYTDIQAIRNFKSLIKYLRRQLGWPVDEDQADDLTFDYTPQELDLDEAHAVKIREIKQLRPLAAGQPWGIFWIDFEPKRLPVVVMRRILSRLVTRKRATAKTKQATWNLRDLMFVSATGEGNTRGISFAHFRDAERADGQPQLRTFSWDVNENHLYYLAHLNLAALRWPEDERDIEGWQAQWAAAFTSGHRQAIQTAKDLASRMAQLAAGTRAAVNDVYACERATGPLHKLYDTFKRVLIHDLTIDDFADMYAQTVTYGLFSARVTRSGQFKLDNVSALIPNTNPFLRELLEECLKVSAGGKRQIDLDELGVGELVETLHAADMEAVMYDFGRQSRDHKEDPVIHFYQSFLREYDADKQLKRGVIYTPDPVVQFIVRSIDYLLRSRFDCADGVADTGTLQWQGKTYPKVLMLDPAVGTGTFDEYMIRVIHETVQHNHRALKPADRQAKWNEYVAEHLLPRLYGFELMMAPYTVAHTKLGLVLKETGYDFSSAERLHIYLTNTLLPTDEVPRVDVPFLAHEAEKAHEAKEHLPVTVVYGNPPYAGHSANASKNADGTPNFIGRLLRDYYQVDGQPLGERNPKWLQDDYVKFMRYGQWRIAQTGAGILAMITNHGYLDNPTFRGMRQQLMQTFDEIYVLDLHGNSKKKEVAPDGSPDENVFDIMQGVAICLMIKHRDSTGKAKVYHAHLRGNRDAKYLFLGNNDMQQVEWALLKPQAPFYLFIPQDTSLRADYEKGWKITEAMPLGLLGPNSHRDDFAIAFDLPTLKNRARDFQSKSSSDRAIKEKYLLSDTRDWTVSSGRKLAQQIKHIDNFLIPCFYRPFDFRYMMYGAFAFDYHRPEINDHLLQPNMAVITTRQTREPFSVVSTNLPCGQHKLATPYDGSYIFPLYVYPTDGNVQRPMFAEARGTGPGGRKPNLAPNFIAEVEKRLGLKFVTDGVGDLKKTVGPEDIFRYIYAVFHSPTYRERYAEFLKIDFPRVPLTGDLDLFRTLAEYGQELVALHLMESPKLNKAITTYTGKGDDVVASGYPAYEDETVWINDTQGFKGVSEDVWEFHIGGYQVCHKWLKDRRGRTLSGEDKAHYARIVVALRETLRLMEAIDAVIPAWPIE